MTDPTTRSALLLGSDHSELEETAVVDLGPDLAVGISRGRFPKGYPHLDPNEDAVFAMTDGTTTILAVADGHRGFEAAKAAITAIGAHTESSLRSEPEVIVRNLAEVAIDAVATILPAHPPTRDRSGASLSICALDTGTLAAATLGDTSCFIATKRRARRIGGDTPFLSPVSEATEIDVTTRSLGATSAVVVASDGFTDFAGDVGASLRTAATMSAPLGVEHLLAEAFTGGAGDNIAIAVLCRS
jgi:serine/threonine protein phosphatase PrpC